MALLLHDLVLEGLANVEPHIRVVQNSVEAGSLEIFMNGGISGDSLLGSVPLHSMLSGASHGRLESHIGPDIRISFDHEFLDTETSAADIDATLVQAILQTSDTTPFKEAEKLVFLSGNAYEGDRRGLTMHGQGLYSWKDDGAVFKGDFKNNMPAGRGQYVWADGSTYTGGVSRGQREGVGVFTAADVTYDGDWVARKRHGRGTLESNEGRYDGEWVDHVKEGHGVMHYANGNCYTGSWLLDAKSGFGTMEWFDRLERYTGEWRCGLQHGEGEHIWLWMQDVDTPFQMRERYCGHWEKGERHGLGSFYYANGSSYKGMWQANKKHGTGAFTFEDGSVFEGVFVHDRMADGNVVAATEIPAHLTNIADDDARGVQNLLVSHGTRVRQIYFHYTQLGCDQEEAFEMTIDQYHQFLLDANLCSPELSLAEIQRMVFPSAENLSVQLPRNSKFCSAVRLRSLLQKSTPATVLEGGFHTSGTAGSLVERKFIQSLVSIAALMQPIKDGLSQQLRSVLMNHLLPLPLANEDQVRDGPRTLACSSDALLLLYTFYCDDAALPRFTKTKSRNALTVRGLIKLLRDADIVADHTNVAELLVKVLPSPYCSGLALALAQQKEVIASEGVECKGELLNEADAGNANGEAHTEHTEAKASKLIDEATRDAFGRLLDTELLFAEFQQAFSALANIVFVQTDAAKSDHVDNQRGGDGIQRSSDSEDEATSTSTSEQQAHQYADVGNNEMDASKAEDSETTNVEGCVLLLNDVILPRVIARLDDDVARLRKVEGVGWWPAE